MIIEDLDDQVYYLDNQVLSF